MQIFLKTKHSQNGPITLLSTDVGKSCPSYKFLTWQICLFSQIFPNLLYPFVLQLNSTISPGPEVIILVSMLNSNENEISTAHKN